MTPHLDLKDVAVIPRRSPAPLVADVTLRLAPGEIALIEGEDGAASTGLLRGILGLLPHSGEAQVLGRKPGSAANAAAIGYAPAAEPLHANLTVREMVALIAGLHPGTCAVIDDTLGICGLTTEAERPCHSLDVEHTRRTCLALAAVRMPTLLLIGDAWESPETRAVIDDTLSRGGAAVITSAEPVGLCDWASHHVTIDEGRAER